MISCVARCIGLIPAAGQGARLGGETPKQYLAARRPADARARGARRCLRDPAVELAFVVLAPDDERWATHDWSAFRRPARAALVRRRDAAR